MVINKTFTTVFSQKEYQEIISYIKFDSNTQEYCLNSSAVYQNNWEFAAIDDNTIDIETGELDRLLTYTIDSKLFYCINIKDILEIEDLNKLNIFEFNNIKSDWLEILSPYNEYTLWECVLFDKDFTIFIIKPWSAGYNTLICTDIIKLRNICTDAGWIFNDKYPITPM